MSLPAWPAGLKYQPETDGFRVSEPHVPPRETEFEGGARRRRPTSTLRRAVFAMTWDFSEAEYQTFRTFYHRTLVDGTSRFTMLVPDGVGGAYFERTCMFKGMYQAAQPALLRWRISAELFVTGGV